VPSPSPHGGASQDMGKTPNQRENRNRPGQSRLAHLMYDAVHGEFAEGAACIRARSRLLRVLLFSRRTAGCCELAWDSGGGGFFDRVQSGLG